MTTTHSSDLEGSEEAIHGAGGAWVTIGVTTRKAVWALEEVHGLGRKLSRGVLWLLFLWPAPQATVLEFS